MLFKISILVLVLSYFHTLQAQLPSACLSSIQQGVADTINKQRTCHGNCVALAINAELTGLAQSWANYLGTTVLAMKHNPNRATATLCKNPITSADNYCGENIYQLKNSRAFATDSTSCYAYGKKAATSWYNEIKDWNFSTSSAKTGATGATGHFTQNVWCYTKTLGVGSSSFVANGWNNLMIVADFQPGGNFNNAYSTYVKANSTACVF